MILEKIKFSAVENASLLADRIVNKAQSSLHRPIFIVGTGRCGTSLLVDILNSHSSLVGFPGEANNLWHPALYPYEEAEITIPPIEVHPLHFTQLSLRQWPKKHHETIRRIFSGYHKLFGQSKTFFTKSAMISFIVPKIVAIFPDARFIHLYRAGPSVVESYFKKNHGRYEHHHYTDNEYMLYCARYWNDCILELEREREKRKDTTPFVEMSYESLCANPTAELGRLASLLELDMDAFAFDLSTIKSTNYKVGDYLHESRWAEPLKAMEPAMRLKGYL